MNERESILIPGEESIDDQQKGDVSMTQIERTELFNDICSKYRSEMNIHSGDCKKDKDIPYSIVFCKEIVMSKKAFSHPSAWDIMCLLHEIGHIKTNNIFMPVCEKEYLATQWSVDEAKKIGFPIEDIWKDCFQNYIWNYYDEENETTNALNMTKNDLVIRW